MVKVVVITKNVSLNPSMHKVYTLDSRSHHKQIAFQYLSIEKTINKKHTKKECLWAIEKEQTEYFYHDIKCKLRTFKKCFQKNGFLCVQKTICYVKSYVKIIKSPTYKLQAHVAIII